MESKKNIGSIKDCYGCGVCAAACPKHIIELQYNKKGFYQPILSNEESCINCKICLDVCSFSHKEFHIDTRKKKSWASWSNDYRVRNKCTSGGTVFEIGRQLIENGYKIIACRYNSNNQRVEHYIATTEEELEDSMGSKYIQSFTVDAFSKIDRKQKYLVIGTPCQIDSMRRFVHKYKCETNFLFLDFFCQSVPSIHVWNAYKRMLRPHIGNVTDAVWRNKTIYSDKECWRKERNSETHAKHIDWHSSLSMFVCGDKAVSQINFCEGDEFYKYFIQKYSVGLHCQNNCKYKYDKSCADLRVGDLWGTTYMTDSKGVSALVAFTSKGEEVVKTLRNVTLIEHPFEIVAEGQHRHNVKEPLIGPLLNLLLRNEFDMDSFPIKTAFILQRLVNCFIKLIKKF